MAVLVPANGMVARNVGTGTGALPGQAADTSAMATMTTDSTGGTAQAAAAAGVGIYWLHWHFNAADFANGDMVTDWTLGHKFKILSFVAICTKAVTTGAKAATLNLEIGTTNLTGGSLALSGTYALGSVTAATAITAANTGSAAATISLEASSVTTFAEGEFDIAVQIQNMDSADAMAAVIEDITALATKADLIRTNLRAASLMA